jgi:hypothetical protein
MKYIIIILLLLGLTHGHKIINKINNIEWARIITNIQQYKYESLKILEPAITAVNAVIYIKIDYTKKEVDLFLILTEHLAFNLGLYEPTIMPLPSNLKVYRLHFNMIHVNSLLTIFFDQNVEIFYALNNVRYVEIDELHQAFRPDFKVFELTYDIKQVSNFGNPLSTCRQKSISKARNEKIGKILTNLKTNPNVKNLREALIPLYLSNRHTVLNILPQIVHQANTILIGLTKGYDFWLDGSHEGPLQHVYSNFIHIFTNWDEERINKDPVNYNQLINQLINKSINLSANIIMYELEGVSYFEHEGSAKLLELYLDERYFTFQKTNSLQKVFLRFFKSVVFMRQLNLLRNNSNLRQITRREKIAFYNEFRGAYNKYKNRDNLNIWHYFPINENMLGYKFSFYKNEFERYARGELVKFIKLYFRFDDVRDNENYFDVNVINPVIMGDLYRNKVLESNKQCSFVINRNVDKS